MRVPAILAVAALGLFTLAAKADTFQTFDLDVTFLGAGTITGTVDLDLSSTSTHDEFDSTADLTYTDGATTTQFTGWNFSYGSTSSSPYDVYLTFLDSSTDHLVLMLPVTAEGSLAGFNGGLCTYLSSCNSNLTTFTPVGSYGYGALVGTFTPEVSATPTPEPASIALLGTGLLGLTGCMRKRICRSA
jgi:hypothetical protein